MGATKVPVMDSVRAAVAFARLYAPRVSGVLGALMLASVASAVVGRSVLGVALFVVNMGLGLMANAALLRLAFADEHVGEREFRVGPLGFQWGPPELRLLGAGLLLIFLMLLGFLFWFVIAVLGGTAATVFSGSTADVAAAGTRPDSPAMLTAGVLGLAMAVALAWAGVRVCLYSPATVAERHIQVFSTWPLTRGRFWPILGALLVLMTPALVLALLQEAWRPLDGAGMGLAIAIAAVNSFVELPLICGLYAYLYKRLRTDGVLEETASGAAVAAAKGPWG